MRKKHWEMIEVVLLAGAVVLCFVGPHLGLIWHFVTAHGFDAPPRVGEGADSVIQRLGTPHHDSRASGADSDRDFRLGYTDDLGTRHHLHVRDGVIIEIEYSSR